MIMCKEIEEEIMALIGRAENVFPTSRKWRWETRSPKKVHNVTIWGTQRQLFLEDREGGERISMITDVEIRSP